MNENFARIKAYVIGSFVGIIGIWLLVNVWTIVPAGEIGVKVLFGDVNPTPISEGFHLVNPLSNIQKISVRLQKETLTGSNAGTRDLQVVHTDIVANYRLDASKVSQIYKEYGFDLKDKVLSPAINESFKAITAHYNSEELITKRDEVSGNIKQELQNKVSKYGILIGDISLVNFGFSEEYQKAIEAKVIATQSTLKAQQDLIRIKTEAEQSVARADGEAKAIKIQTEAINSAGGVNYVQLKAIEKWNGSLPQVSGGNTPFINLKGE